MFWLRSAVQLLFTVILVMSVVGHVVMKDSIVSLDSAIVDVSSAAELRNGIAGIRKAGLLLYNIQQGILPATLETEERRNLYYQAGNLSFYNTELYLHMQSLSSELRTLYVEPTVMIEDIVDGKVVTTWQNLWQAMNNLLSHAYLMHEQPLAQITELNPHYFVSVYISCFPL